MNIVSSALGVLNPMDDARQAALEELLAQVQAALDLSEQLRTR